LDLNIYLLGFTHRCYALAVFGSNENTMSTLNPNVEKPTSPAYDRPDTRAAPKDKRQGGKDNATTGASAAGMRALTARMFAFYFRVPVKAFFRTRIE